MFLNNDIQKQIARFAEEESRRYMDYAELTYLEKFKAKSSAAKEKAKAKLEKWKSGSEQSKEAQDDMILYMSDYVGDLISRGYSEEDAFQKAKSELTLESGAPQAARLQDRYSRYYENIDPAVYEVIGVYYAASIFICITLGAVAGLFLGKLVFDASLWMSALVGGGAGFLLGIGVGLLQHGRIVHKKQS